MANVLFAGISNLDDLYVLNHVNGSFVADVGFVGFQLTGLAIDPTSGIMYGATNNSDNTHPHSLITIDMSTGAGTFVGDFGSVVADIAFKSDGTLYGSKQPGTLVTINKASAALTTVGSFGISALSGGGLEFIGSTLYLMSFVTAGHNNLYTVNTSTGTATLVGASGAVNPIGGLAYNSDDSKLYGVSPFDSKLYTIDTSTSIATFVADLAVRRVDGIVFGTFVAPPTPIAADFTGTPTSGAASLLVAFTDASTPGPSGPITAWSWTFGDGGTSSTQNPSHTYTTAGTYTVSLTVTGTSPDGTATKTRTNYITVVNAPTNSTQDTAENLTPNCSSAIVSNAFGATTPDFEDPLNTVYGYGDVFSRQVWFKLTNTSGRQAYARFTITQPVATASDIVGAIYLENPAAAIPSYSRSFGGDQTTFIATPLTGGSSRILGTALKPGQTVWLELAGYDVPGSGWNGNMGLQWELLNATFYDSPDEFTGGAQFRGTLQAGAVVTPVAKSYCKAGNLHFAAVYDNGISSLYGDLSVWVWTDGGGAATVYTVPGVQLQGEGIGWGVGSGIPMLRTDGANVWLINYTRETQASCPGNTFTAHVLQVSLWNGAGFTSLGLDLSAVHPLPGISPGAWFQEVGQLAAAASSAEPGVLHVVWCEAGPDTCNLTVDFYPNHVASRVSYTKWDTGGLVVQNNILSDGQSIPAGSPPVLPSPLGVALTQWLGITNAYGDPVLFHAPSVTHDPDGSGSGSITYDSIINMYSIDGSGVGTLLQSFDGATDGTVTHVGYLLESSAKGVTMGITMKQPQEKLFGADTILFGAVWGSGGSGSGYIPTLTVPKDGSSVIRELTPSNIEGGEFREAIIDHKNIWYGAGAFSSFSSLKIHGKSLTCPGGFSDYTGVDSFGTAPITNATSSEFFWDDVEDCFFVLGCNSGSTQFAPLKIPILRDWLICSVGSCVAGLHIWQHF